MNKQMRLIMMVLLSMLITVTSLSRNEVYEIQSSILLKNLAKEPSERDVERIINEFHKIDGSKGENFSEAS